MLYFETERFILTTKFDMETNVNTTNKPQHDAKLLVSGWRWFDAKIKFNNGNICDYSSTTNGTIEDAKKQAANVIIGQVADVLHIAFR